STRPRDAAARDADQPRDRLTTRRVVRVAVPQRLLEHLARDVLRLGTSADPVRDVRVRPLHERFWIREGILGHSPRVLPSGSETKPCAYLRDLGGERIEAQRLQGCLMPSLAGAGEREVEPELPVIG